MSGHIQLSTCLLLLVLTGARFASAHDFWIEPASYQPNLGVTLPVRLLVGEALSGSPYRRNPAHLKEFFLAGSSGRKLIEGGPGSEPAGFVLIEEPGSLLLGYQSTHNLIELEADRFEAYLDQEQFKHAIEARARNGQTGQAGRESFTRYAKSLLHVGPTPNPGQGHDTILGFAIELVPEQNSYSLLPGQTLTVRILFYGMPLPGARVVAYNKHEPAEAIVAYSDAHGRVRFNLPRAGVWLLRSVHLVPAPVNPEADWESYWASLTFDLPGRD